MYILYFDHMFHEYYHAEFHFKKWPNYDSWRASEGNWLVPGTDPEDCFYGVFE